MLLLISGTKIVGSMTTGSKQSDKKYESNHPGWVYSEFVFDNPLDAYIVSDGTFILDPDWTPPPATEEQQRYAKLSPIEFKLCFTAQERVAIKALRETDSMINDFLELLDDPRLTTVDLSLQGNIDAIDYLILVGAIAQERKPDILSGKFN